MKKIVFKISLLVLALSILFSFSGCGESFKVRAMLSDFQTACNEMKLREAADYIDNPIFNVIDGVAGIAGNLLSGGDDAYLADLYDQFIGALGGMSASDYLKTMEIKVSKVRVDGFNAQASATISSTGSDGATYLKDVVFQCALTGDVWKITNIVSADNNSQQ